MSEPKVKRNKKCLVCNGERKFGYQRGVSLAAYEKDPFCSAVCAKKYYGVTDSTTPVVVNPSKHRGPGITLRRSKHA